ncbi:MAG: 30S ribosomal protein S6 [Candidatus Moraniibacteriota bacterium]
MRQYELFYLVGESKEAELDAIRTEVEKIFTDEGATFLPEVTSDKRKLAYVVEKETRGIYVARRFTLPDKSELSSAEFDEAMKKGDTIAELNRKIALSKNILRSLIIRADELPELKAIERTEYAKREVRGRGGRPMAPRPMAPAPVSTSGAETEAKPVSKEQIDKKLEEVLNI